MDNIQTLKRDFDTVAWGAFFIWWGITEVVKTLPEGTGAVGIGLILLGLNAARALNGLPLSRFTTILGLAAFILGALELLGTVLALPFELPIFAILLVTLGVILIANELRHS